MAERPNVEEVFEAWAHVAARIRKRPDAEAQSILAELGIGGEWQAVHERWSRHLNEDITAEDPLVKAYVQLMRDWDLDIAGIEFVEDAEGVRYTYDINGTTNYNGEVEAQHGLSGMAALARLVERELESRRLQAA